jgi:subtilisin family serine protease
MIRHRTAWSGTNVVRLAVLLLIPLVMVACSTPSAPTFDAQAEVTAAESAGRVIPGRFIVTLRDGADPARVAGQYGVRPEFTYRHALNGFAGAMSEAARLGLMADARVLHIEPDQTVHVSELTTQSTATWGLDRVDQRPQTLDTVYSYGATGSGVTAYIIDTGILSKHVDFGKRVQSRFFDAFGGDGEDCNGHGTHVAGTVGGTVYGVAKGVSLVAVRVLNCSGSGSWSGVIAGVDWVTADAAGNSPAVANMSLGGGASTAVDTAVRNSIESGVVYAVAAGNGNSGGKEQDACGYSPARVRQALTVGATDSTDTKTSWSNYGECVDLFAPGRSITSAWYTSTTAVNIISGTSMASPHVAGVAALYLEQDATASSATVFSAVQGFATQGVVKSSRTANNHLLFSLVEAPSGGGSGGGGGGGGGENAAPVASFTFTCSGLTCTFTDTSTDDGGITSRSWTFGDGNASTATSPSHAYSAAGTYTVTLTVTDNGSPALSNARTQSVTVSVPGAITLTGVGYKRKGGYLTTDLSWSGANGGSVTITRRAGSHPLEHFTVLNAAGTWTDNTNFKGGGTIYYRLCETSGAPCSEEIAVVF